MIEVRGIVEGRSWPGPPGIMAGMTEQPARVLFVCHGNICRSAMAERVAIAAFADAGIDAEIWSAGVSDEEHGNPMDFRAQRLMKKRGYSFAGHRAHQVSRAEIDRADLVLAFEPYHIRSMLRIAPDATNLRLITDFIPGTAAGSSVDDPWYGGEREFVITLEAIEAAMPEIVNEFRPRR